MIQFDYPLNERMRTFLRLETLFDRLDSCLNSPEQKNFLAAVNNLINVLHIFTCRVDLKAELIKEMERQQALLIQFQSNPNADQETLEQLLGAITPLLDDFHNRSQLSLGHALKDSEFIKTIAQRNAIPGGMSSFDLPNLHMWLHRPQEEKRADLKAWCDSFSSANQSILLILKIIRNSALPEDKLAEKGFINISFDKARSYQMLHINIDNGLQVYPEISGNKHRCIIRFMNYSIEDRPKQTSEDIPFQLTCCHL